MKTLLIASLAVTSLLPTGQAAAANFGPGATTEVRASAFAGARFRLPLGPKRSSEKPQFGLTFAPMLRGESTDGRVRMRFGEGVGIGFAGDAKPRLMLGGAPLTGRLSAAQDEAEGSDRKKDSTGKKVLKGAAVVAIVAVAVVGGFFIAYSIACGDNRCSE